MSSGEDSDPTRSERARINGRLGGRPPGPANLKDAHPLFLWEEGERIIPIGWINVRRYTAQGPVDCPRIWSAEELRSDDDVFTLFGGGTYELLGRNALPNGQPGQVVRRRRLMLEGASKPFSGEQPSQAQATAAGAAAPMGTTSLDLMVAMMREDRREAREREERRDAQMRDAEERREAREAQRSQSTVQLVTGALGIVAPVLQAIITRPAPVPPPAPPSAADALLPLLQNLLANKLGENPLENLKKVFEVAKELRPDPEPPQKSESLPELLQGFGQAAAGIAQLEQQRIEAAKHGQLSPAPMPGADATPTANGHAPQTITSTPPPAFPEDSPAATLDS